MATDFFLSWQFGVTLLVALGLGIWQFTRVRRAKRTDEHSVMTTPGAGPDGRA